MSEEAEAGASFGPTVLDHYAIAIMNGFCSNAALQGASEEEVVTKAFEMAQVAMRVRLGASEDFFAEIFFLMDAGRYVAAISRPSKTITYTRSEREAIIYFDAARATDDGDFVRSCRMEGDLRRGKALITANGKVTPQPVTDWKEQMIAEGKTPPEEPAEKAGGHGGH